MKEEDTDGKNNVHCRYVISYLHPYGHNNSNNHLFTNTSDDNDYNSINRNTNNNKSYHHIPGTKLYSSL